MNNNPYLTKIKEIKKGCGYEKIYAKCGERDFKGEHYLCSICEGKLQTAVEFLQMTKLFVPDSEIMLDKDTASSVHTEIDEALKEAGENNA
jgi:hypothetical protein